MITQCSSCGKFEISEGAWGNYYPREIKSRYDITHVNCPECQEQYLKDNGLTEFYDATEEEEK